MTWIDAAADLRRSRRPAVLVTLAAVRGHAPREAGAKMIVTADAVLETIGGGNLEMTAVIRAREMLADPAAGPELLTLRLNDKAPAKYGRQCCGGEVTVLLEPLRVPTTIAIFGLGNVGLELARILSRQDLELHLSDSRPEQLEGLDVLEPSVARIHPEPAVMGEEVIGRLPEGAHVLIMTHDHAEDLHLCDAALRHPGLASIGLIGSDAKWTRFKANLTAMGHEEGAVEGIDCPIGLPGVPGKLPATIAVSVAADLLTRIAVGGGTTPA
ncbi:xanthine dehydrogenase accessory protein XdhC [Zhihengliuella sp.]|uniref:xanthine dehydrogenase accessory protein XdhC n=1 Tax=Zhihengliuella sp. TaxID=1954483 RepID=UPI0028128D7B|nr:xanthine dehydrogenase accessory protein XdhC [Zhihengliuella sp.]